MAIMAVTSREVVRDIIYDALLVHVTCIHSPK